MTKVAVPWNAWLMIEGSHSRRFFFPLLPSRGWSWPHEDDRWLKEATVRMYMYVCIYIYYIRYMHVHPLYTLNYIHGITLQEEQQSSHIEEFGL